MLRDEGVPIRDSRDGRDIRHWAHGDVPDLRIDGEVLMALRISLGLLRPFEGTALAASIDQLQRRLEAMLPPNLAAHFWTFADALAVRVDAPPSPRDVEGLFGRPSGVLSTTSKGKMR